MLFEFATAGRIVFGGGARARLVDFCRASGARALLVSGSSAERSACAEEALTSAGIPFEIARVRGEPTVEEAERVVARGREARVDFVVAIGGGSAIDLGKAVAALLPAPGEPLDYLEVIGRGQALERPALPVLALPTTAGTGAEVTKNAVLASSAHQVKVSLRHDSMLPRLALVDPELTWSVSPATTAATGLDALTQCLEPYLSSSAQPLTDALSLEGLARGARSLVRAVEDGKDAAAREDMALCSLLGGLSLANAKLGAVHGFAGPLGGMFDAPHGALCARLLPLVFEVNLRALRARASSAPSLGRFDHAARVLTGRSAARAEDGLEWLQELTDELRVPALASYGVTRADVPVVVDKAAKASSMKGNPIQLEREELVEILERAL